MTVALEVTVEEAAERLGVKPATLYAYVSRGLLAPRRLPDGRSLFLIEDIERLAQRGRSGSGGAPPRNGEILVQSAITTLGPDSYFFRGVDALELARTRTFEEVSTWIWTGSFDLQGEWRADPAALASGRAAEAALARDILPMDRLRVILAAVAPTDPLRYQLESNSVVLTAVRLISALVDCLPGAAADETGSLAGRLWSRLAGRVASEAEMALLNACLVMLLDHDLSVSTYTARVAASIDADPYAVVSVGLSSLGGPLQAVASLAAEDFLGMIETPADAARVIGDRLRRGDRLPGLGHRLYPQGDPRARLILEELDRVAGDRLRLEVAKAVLQVTGERGLPPPNVDFALAALGQAAGLVRGASEAIFAIARSSGWLAHALEEYAGESRIRPRLVYTGVPAPSER